MAEGCFWGGKKGEGEVMIEGGRRWRGGVSCNAFVIGGVMLYEK